MEDIARLARLLCALVARLETILGPWLALATRLWLAQAFLMAQIHGGMAPAGLSAPFAGWWWAGLVGDVTASQAGVAVQAICPLLLASGCSGGSPRLAMLLQAALLSTPGVAAGTQVFWAALLLRIALAGPGRLSVDGVVGPGLRSIALPGSAAAQRVLGWARRVLGPVYRLGLRLWLAAAPAGAALAALSVTQAMQPGLVWWLPSLPMVEAKLATGPALALAVLLVCGAGRAGRRGGPAGAAAVGPARVRRCAAVLGAAAGAAGRCMAAGSAVGRSWLCWRGCAGCGRRPISRRCRMWSWSAAGSAGSRRCTDCGARACRITLIDQRNHHLFQPLLYQVATAGLSPADIATPIRSHGPASRRMCACCWAR